MNDLCTIQKFVDVRKPWNITGKIDWMKSAIVGTVFFSMAHLMKVEAAEGYLPKDDSVVLLRLRTGPKESADFRALKTSLDANPNDVGVAVSLAKLYMQIRRERSDPRYLGLARGALSPWWNDPNPAYDVLLLRAKIKQSEHFFRESLVDLDAAIAKNPRDGQAWLIKLSVHQVLGEYPQAAASILPLSRLASSLVSITAATSLASLQGRSQNALNTLRSALEIARKGSPEVLAWAWGTLAEIAVRTGDGKLADEAFAKALAASPDDYLRGAQADFWLDQNRAPEVISALRDYTSADALLLRYALAEKQVNAPDLANQIAELRARLEATRHRTNNLHAREEARFLLSLGADEKRALELAKINWNVQHEPADVRLLLECALACKDKSAAQPALEWVTKTNLEDISLKPLIEGLKEIP